LSTARPSVLKKQREQKKRERQLIKAEKRAQRKADAHREPGGGPPIEADDYE
jgi:hypothetical protein